MFPHLVCSADWSILHFHSQLHPWRCHGELNWLFSSLSLSPVCHHVNETPPFICGQDSVIFWQAWYSGLLPRSPYASTMNQLSILQALLWIGTLPISKAHSVQLDHFVRASCHLGECLSWLESDPWSISQCVLLPFPCVMSLYMLTEEHIMLFQCHHCVLCQDVLYYCAGFPVCKRGSVRNQDHHTRRLWKEKQIHFVYVPSNGARSHPSS